MKCSDLMVKCLENEDIKYVFGVPGEENADFMISLEKSERIEFILTRHEQGAAFMADAYGRLTGNPAACLGTLGPGATNLITGVADGNMDRSPMLALIGQADTQRLHKESHQAMNSINMYEPVTKWAQTIWHPDNTPEIMRKAVRVARTEKPGACLVELPEDIAGREATTEPIPVQRFRRPVPDDKIVDMAWTAIKNAKRPVILAGNGCIRKRASKQLRRFAQTTGIGVISTFMAKGCVDMDEEICCYTIGLQARDFPAVAIEQSDLVICIGYDLVEYHPHLWNPKGEKQIVHLDFIPAEIDEHYRLDVEVIGDLAHALWMFTERAKRDDISPSSFDHEHTRWAREEMQKDLKAHADDKTKGSIRPQKALWDARQVMGPEDILLSDVGAHKMWIARHYHCHEPNTCLISNGFCSMGFAFPGALGAHIVHPDKRILAVCGDAGFLMNVQEMETARRINANIVVMVWEDNSYGLIAWKQRTHFGHNVDLTFSNPNWRELAQSFGWKGHWCENSADLADTLERAFVEDGPSLVAIPIDYSENDKLTSRLGDIQSPI